MGALTQTPTFDAIMRDLYAGPMVDGFPPRTEFTYHWHAARDAYVIWLTTYRRDSVVCSEVLLRGRDASRALAMPGVFTKLVDHRLWLLRFRHYFALVYQRGGYC